jgi:hypothetical protein
MICHFPFDDAWKLAMLAQVPVVTESTVTFDPPGSDQVLGVGNAVFQTILAHAIDERWAFGIGARLVARSVSDDVGNGRANQGSMSERSAAR